jgi:hypothetical protein
MNSKKLYRLYKEECLAVLRMERKAIKAERRAQEGRPGAWAHFFRARDRPWSPRVAAPETAQPCGVIRACADVG